MTRRAPLAVPFAALVTAAALACAPAPPPGGRVDIAEETAVIVWDEVNKTEHFVRRANFQSTSADFGFLVPTPSRPELGQAEESVFGQLATVTAPKVEYRTVKRPRPTPSRGGNGGIAKGAAAPPMPGGVEVLEHKQFKDTDAVVLTFRRGAGDDPAAGAEQLAKWLKDRGYEFGPSLAEWLRPYVAHDWVLTAFRITSGRPRPGGLPDAPGTRSMYGTPVRMSFQADRPFYPYREPAEQRDERARQVPRSLRVFLLAPARFAGALGTSPWHARTVWSDKLTADQVRAVAAGVSLPAERLPAGELTLTEFEDTATPRPGTDEVYFGRSPDQSAVARPPVIHEVVEYYDAPESAEPGSGSEPRSPVAPWAVLSAAGGFVVFVLLLFFLAQALRRR